MTDDFDAVVDALAEAWAVWAATGRSLAPEQWRAPTRLGGWDVAATYAHHSQFPAGLAHLVRSRRDGPPDRSTAADLLRSFNQPGGLATTAAAGVAERAVATAAASAPGDLVARFEEGAAATIAAVRQAGQVTVDYFGTGTVPLGEATRIGVVEATVHLLDVLRAVDGDVAVVPAAALAMTRDVLVDMADAVDLVEAATGRTSTSPFPVLR